MEYPQIIFENEEVVVINKPPHLIAHSDGRTSEPSVAEWMRDRYEDIGEVGEPWVSPQGETILRPGIVHRLDRTTSGVMIMAKNKETYVFLKNQFQERMVEKEYRAFVYGHIKNEEGIIEREIVRIRSTPPRWGVLREGEGKKHREAITLWRCIGRGSDHEKKEEVSYLSLSPKTGRTHQIRVHMKAIGHPVVGDHLYASKRPGLVGFTRPALHALSLSLSIKRGAPPTTFVAPLWDDFKNAESLYGGSV